MRATASLVIAATAALCALASTRAEAKEQPARQQPAASYSAAAATGPRDVAALGDSPKAWATSEADAGPEWLRLRYAEPLPVREIRIWQNDAPGAIAWVTAEVDGREVEVWRGTDALSPSPTTPVEKVVTLQKPLTTATVTLYLDTRRVAGWNEIDAVEVVAADGRRAWAVDAEASSHYGESKPKTDPLAAMVGREVIIRVDGERLGGKLLGGDAEWIALHSGQSRVLIKRDRISWVEQQR